MALITPPRKAEDELAVLLPGSAANVLVQESAFLAGRHCALRTARYEFEVGFDTAENEPSKACTSPKQSIPGKE